MVLRTAVYYTALAIGLLVLAGIAASIVAGLVSLLWNVLVVIATALVVAGLLYAGIKGALWLRDHDTDDATADRDADRVDGTLSSSESYGDTEAPEPVDPVDRLTERYVEGKLTEAEFERRIERELETERATEGLDREMASQKEVTERRT